MVSFEIVWKHSALRDIRSLPCEVVASCLGKRRAPKSNPFPAGVRKIRGTDHTYRLRMDHHRIIYQIDDTCKVLIICHIRHRKDVYGGLPSSGS